MCKWEIPERLNKVVIKIGTRVIVSSEAGLDEDFIENIAQQVEGAGISNVVIVSSGAIGAGMKRMGIERIPSSIPVKQALAAIGQSHLIRTYEKLFEKYGKRVAQILLTGEDLGVRSRFLNAVNTFDKLFSMNVIPVVNENDTVTVEEITLGDNDSLSAKVAILIEADILIILTDVDGVYTGDPAKNSDAELIKCISHIDRKFIEKFKRSLPTPVGTGGMFTKLTAAYEASLKGIPTIIANGKKENIIQKILSGEEKGTLVLPRKKKMRSKKLWLATMSKPKGAVIIDSGAVTALKKGKSLLPSGIKDVTGSFTRGDIVGILDENGNEIARGLSEYNSEEILKIKGHNSAEIEKILGYFFAEEVTHRDKMVIMEESGGERRWN